MQIFDAINLIKNAIPTSNQPLIWADLGCGSGVFTLALSHLLPKGSTIYAIDKTFQQLPPKTENGVHIQFIRADIEKSELAVPLLDGILMANALHYVKNQSQTIVKLEKLFTGKKQFILIEYDSSLSNRWVPYPIPFADLKKLFPSDTYECTKIGERSSIYGQGNLYCALLTTKS